MNLFNEEATLLVEGGGSGALSGEEYRRRLARALADPFLREMVLDLPYGSGSGFRSPRIRQAGYVFCARIGDYETPWFRFVAADQDTWKPVERQNAATGAMSPWIDEDTLTCLVAADPGEEGSVEQDLSPEAQVGVFEAWSLAQEHIYTQWSALSDWANLQPKIEKALREAVELVAEHGGHLGLEIQGDLVARLNGRWERAVVKAVRDIVRDEERTSRERVDALLGFVSETGLPIPEQPKPLPTVRRDDIRVVCWMAVTPDI
jgi:hypothetical protein